MYVCIYHLAIYHISGPQSGPNTLSNYAHAYLAVSSCAHMYLARVSFAQAHMQDLTYVIGLLRTYTTVSLGERLPLSAVPFLWLKEKKWG